MSDNQIKSRERVRELAEVYTRDREADAMLDLVDEAFGISLSKDSNQISTISPEIYLRKKYLEPSCGNGNFLVHILLRKLNAVTNAELEPDTTMLHDNKIYVIDAKFYKFGVSGNPGDSPESSSINKQITYGEYIATHEQTVSDCSERGGYGCER